MNEYSEEFHLAQVNGGISFESPEYVALMQNTCDYLIKRTNPRNSIEIGPGVGVLLYMMNLRTHWSSVGFDRNRYSQQYYVEFCKNKFWDADWEGTYSVEPLDWKIETDLLVSIECFEHLTNEQIIGYMDKIKAHYFYFSSIPHKCTPFERDGKMWDDASWGHVNIKETKEWIDFFSEWGYKAIERPNKVTEWDVLFERQ